MEMEIAETIVSATKYLKNLTGLQDEIRKAEKQILTTFDETSNNIKSTFSNLRKVLSDILTKREEDLLQKAEEAKNDGLVPLVECSNIIKRSIESTTNLIHQGSTINGIASQDFVSDFLDKGNLLGILPELPEAKEVPYISFLFDPMYESDLKNVCVNIGEVFRVAPIQIQKLTPKPGALLIEWQQKYDTGDDRVKDIQEFRLQRAFGDVTKQKNTVNFLDCYRGLDTQFLLRDIQICQPYSFRICCKFDGFTVWSPWSVPQVGITTLKWYSWEASEDSVLTNDNKIAKVESSLGKIVYSDGAQVSFSDSLEFTILDVDQRFEAAIAVIQSRNKNCSILKEYNDGIFLIDSNGKIFIDGVEKSTVLPKFAKGLKVGFSLEKISDDKILVNLDSNEKRVTYHWCLNDGSKLYFAAHLASQWKIMVE
ncbi:cytokine receptor-like factor 3 [Sitophilus oryzae]|uniref:Cytokine receptor-like factor 3 n=1 Tax=Sitophilus oryzae TaxID=7048 RepID=A0A6J2YJ22_SITOR|nr:cytokine receptor-like factor 3 [Sitophilus oryzae]XP_030763266.1 cytokine receptor-like factor 3 [Sitophilus oryzae]